MKIEKISMNDIEVDKNQPRKDFQDIDDLMKSIIKEGLLEPLKVIPNVSNGKKYLLVDGERRYKALHNILKVDKDFEIVDCIVIEKPKKIKITQLVTDIQKQKLSPLEEANSFKELIQKDKLSINEIAMRIGKGREYIVKRLKLTAFSPWVQERIKNKEIPISVIEGIDVKTIKSKEREIFTRIREEGADGRRAKEIIHEETHKYQFRTNAFINSMQLFVKEIRDFDELLDKEIFKNSMINFTIADITLGNLISEIDKLNISLSKIDDFKDKIKELKGKANSLNQKFSKTKVILEEDLLKGKKHEKESFVDMKQDDETSYFEEERERREMEGLE